MSTIEVLTKSYEFNRTRTLALLSSIEELPNPQQVLGWRPGVGRAHIGWQFMHVGVTEEIFATERLKPEKSGSFQELWPRFRGGSTPDDDIPSTDQIRQVLAESRTHLLETLSEIDESRLDEIPAAFKERGLTLLDVVHILGYHEPHHHGQAHITLNLYKAAHS